MGAVIIEPPPSFEHTTVLLAEVSRALAPEDGGVYLDVTAGGGGHSAALLEASAGARVIACDRDPAAVAAARARLAPFGSRARVERVDFAGVEARLAELGVGPVSGLVADLGVSSHQLADAERGMSFRVTGPLDMRMDPDSGETALELIVRLTQDELANVLFELGEERRSRRVARCIKQALEAGELTTTSDLRRAVVRAVGPRRVGGIDPATRTFQALRIAVNGELDQLRTLLAMAARVLRPGGVAAIISFHSLEDRIVKRTFRESEHWEPVTKKPVVASEAEQAENPRSRSAKLRVARLGASPS
ncbi:MAG: 16S rRNA (cytosine(1402)-N(4))-methyltransferase RsmH [Sorangiineae bacterium]|nr:16S rRNA (cytosine(1402)-N(4))-methyltransferase RsmH [Polyangiaceae bacterium]MEB2322749.1 16S rRNA (cytosine(1402)-N(4))-methyltransferase RsmH [Sorangiineae bacterium]